jgi:hypothetical protein
MNPYGEWMYSSTILDLSTRWRGVVSFTPRPRYPRENRPRYSLDRRLGGPESRSGRCGVISNPCYSVSRDVQSHINAALLFVGVDVPGPDPTDVCS